MNRPHFKEIFYAAERRPEVVFYTSNVEKFLQARLVFQRSGLPNLRHYKAHTDPYVEEYSWGKERLLTNAIEQVTSIHGRNALLFVEDTSLRIDALSDGDSDFPGLAVKEWFSTTSFQDLDFLLSQNGGSREAIIKSDIALHVPGLDRPVFFHGSVRGVVASSAPEFAASLQYPWLTPETFNGWFIPEGSSRRLGEMSIDESWSFDFRIKSLLKLVERLEEYTAALNLPASAYSRKRKDFPTGQLFLVPDLRPVFIVIGKTCAGKTTLGERFQAQGEFQWFEASDVVRGFKASSSAAEDEAMSDFAKRLLQENGRDVVAKKIFKLVEAERSPLVITGFRTLEELEFIKENLPQASVVLVESSERTRFERYLKRARPGSASTLKDFRRLDEEQWGFGLLRVAEDFSDIKIINEDRLEDYFGQIDSVRNGNWSMVGGVTSSIHSARKSEKSQLVRCINALASTGKPMDCNEISALTSKDGSEIRFNNVNKILKRYPELAERIEIIGHKILYKITDVGRTYLRMSSSHKH